MKRFVLPSLIAAGVVALTAVAGRVAARPTVGTSPWGPKDEIGRLNLMTDDSRAAVLSASAGAQSTICRSSTSSGCRAGRPPAIPTTRCG